MGKIHLGHILFDVDRRQQNVFNNDQCALCKHPKNLHFMGGCLHNFHVCGCDNKEFVNANCPKCNHPSSQHIQSSRTNSELITSINNHRNKKPPIYDTCRANTMPCKCLGARHTTKRGYLD